MKIQIDKQVIENVLDCWECDVTLSDAVVIALKRALTAESVGQKPVAWMQSNHLNQLVKRHTGSSMMLARCSDHKAMDDFVPLYTHPAAPEVEHTAGVFMENKHLLKEISALREALEMARGTVVVRDEFERGRRQGLTDAYDECAKLRDELTSALEDLDREVKIGNDLMADNAKYREALEMARDAMQDFDYDKRMAALAKIDEVLK